MYDEIITYIYTSYFYTNIYMRIEYESSVESFVQNIFILKRDFGQKC